MGNRLWRAGAGGMGGSHTGTSQHGTLGDRGSDGRGASGDVGDSQQAEVCGTASGLPAITEEAQRANLCWTWSVTAVQWLNPATSKYEASGYGTTSIDNGGDSTQPEAVVNARFLRATSWDITVSVSVSYTDPGTGDTYSGAGTADVYFSAALNATLLVARSGTGAFATSAKVAVGGLSPQEHYADVQITVKDSKGNPVAGAYVDNPTLSGAGGVDVPGTLAPAGGVTDGNGQITTSKAFHSSDAFPETGTIVAAGSSASAVQHWNECSAPWANDPYFDYDSPADVSYHMQFDTADITGHAVWFDTKTVTGYYWDPTAGPIDPDTGQPTGYYDPASYSETDIDAYEAGTSTDPVLAAMMGDIAFGPTAPDAGTYSTQVVVTLDPNYVVTYIEPRANDASVFDLGADWDG
jgi:hypothetical protein